MKTSLTYSEMVELWEKVGPKSYLPPDADLSRYWILDIETDDLKPKHLWCVVVRNAATDEVLHWSLGFWQQFRDWLTHAKRMGWVFVAHNWFDFDSWALNLLLDVGISPTDHIDTLVMSHLYYPNIPGGHSLDSWGIRLKEPKTHFTDYSHFSEEMLRYCIQDTKVGKKLFLVLLRKMRERKFSELSLKIEHITAYIIGNQRRAGIQFNIDNAVALRDKLRAEQNALGEKILMLFPPLREEVGTFRPRYTKSGVLFAADQARLSKYTDITDNPDGTYTAYTAKPFNIASPLQRVERLLSLGWEPTTFTKPTTAHPKGQPKVDEDSLLEFAKESKIPEVTMIAEWLVLNGRANMIQTWLNSVDIGDSRIHGYINSCGAATRRMTHSSPNTANIPSADPSVRYGKEARSLWEADEGEVLVGYDSAALEMRCFTHYLNNTEVRDLYLNGDPHQFNADLWGVARKLAKNVYYALIYGASDTKLATTSGAHGNKRQLAARGKEIREALLSRTPGLRELTDTVINEFSTGWIKTVDGGFVRSPESSHAAFNYKLQSCGAIIMKLTTCFIWLATTHLDLPCTKVLDVHDEGQYSTQKKFVELLGDTCVSCHKMAGQYLGLNTPLDGEYKYGNNWAETH